MGFLLKLLQAYWKQALIVLAILFAIWWVYDTGYDSGHKDGKAEVQKKFDKYKHEVEEARKASEVKARSIEIQQRETIKIVSQAYEDKLREAQNKANKVAADLRAGNLRLRSEWATCRTSLPGTTPDSSIPDADTILREQSAARIVQLGAQCDAQVSGLQSIVRAMTKWEFVQ